MMQKIFLILCFVSFGWSSNGQEPVQEPAPVPSPAPVQRPYNPMVDTLDNQAARLRQAEKEIKSQEELDNLIRQYKSLAKGYADNFHFKQGYQTFEKYLQLKERKLATEKFVVLKEMNTKFDRMDNKDEAEVKSLQQQVTDIDESTSSLNSRGLLFKNALTIIIIILSLLFAVSLFRTGLRLKEIKGAVDANREHLLANHRMAVLGLLSPGLKESIAENKRKQAELSAELLEQFPVEGEHTTELRAKLKELIGLHKQG
jgi:hypothetical protein